MIEYMIDWLDEWLDDWMNVSGLIECYRAWIIEFQDTFIQFRVLGCT